MGPTFTGSITVPVTALNGSTRLRVRCWDVANGCNPTSCSPCAFGETEEYTVVVQGGMNTSIPMLLKAFLQGPYDDDTDLMQDSLRRKSLVPLTEPYTAMGYTFVGGGGETTTNAVLIDNDPAPNAVVDWVVVEVRDPSTPTTIIRSQAGLLWRDGSIVQPNGQYPFRMNVPDGTYHVSVRHRNHLGVMTNTAVSFTGPLGATVDFGVPGTVTFGTDARKNIGGKMVLWAGDVTFNDDVQYTGVGNDRDPVLSAIGGVVPTNLFLGYHRGDVNMNGTVQYTGLGNDRDLILSTIGGVVPTNIREAQLP
jgi:hypothetical protein